MPTNCPDDIALLAFAMGATENARGDARIAAHLERCASCRGTVVRHRDLAAGVRRATREVKGARGECLDEMAIAALAEGIAAADAREAGTQHLVTCASCRSQLTQLRAALNDPSIAAALPRVGQSRRSHPAFVSGMTAAGLAAAAVVVFAIGGKRTHTEVAVPMRDETGALVEAPIAVAPLDIISSTPVFRWSSVPRANRYRVRVFNLDGVVVWETQTSDTTAVPPSSITLRRTTRYLWKVEARTDFDRWVGSTLTEFQISTDGVRP